MKFIQLSLCLLFGCLAASGFAAEPASFHRNYQVPLALIKPFFEGNVVLAPGQLDKQPYILAQLGEHVVTGVGDKIYVRGINSSEPRNYAIYRVGAPIFDVNKEKILGYNGIYVGYAQLEQLSDPAVFVLTRTVREVIVGDRLVPADWWQPRNLNFTLHAPAKKIAGNIIFSLEGINQTGSLAAVAIDQGAAEGLVPGDVLAILQQTKTIADPYANKSDNMVNLPNRRIGELVVFRVFDHVSYGLVLQSIEAVRLKDKVTNPE